MNEDKRYICKDVVEKIMSYIDNELDYETLRELENHFHNCPECRAFVDTYKKMLQITGSLKKKSFVTPEIRQRLHILLKSRMEEN